jgi:thiol:disulfide interchange protein DsbD
MLLNTIKKVSLLVTISLAVLISLSANAQFWGKKQVSLLSDQDAFGVTAYIDGDKLKIQWSIAEDYYMYRDQFGVKSNTPGAEFGDLVFPKGQIEEDPEFGEVEVYFFNVELIAPIKSLPTSGSELDLTILGQGCNKPVGVCYQPQIRTIKIAFSPSNDTSPNSTESTTQASNATDAVGFANPDNSKKTFWGYVLAAFGAGVLLSFTPCVLPMIPILAGVIAGQKSPSKLHSGWLAICYVAGTIVTYAIAGWLAGASGVQLQAQFQSPLAIGIVCALLVVLAASLFGVFKIQLPSSVQTKLSGTSVNSKSSSFSSFALGLISALVVGACVSPILILTLGAAITQGDPILGAAIMSAMASGMGILMVLFGFGAGWILPRAGAWMNQIQVLFGFMVLGVAIYIASFNDAVPTLFLWSALLLWTAVYLWHITTKINLFSTALRAMSLALGLWGAIALVGGSTGGSDILQPLTNISATKAGQTTHLPFEKVTTVAQAQALLIQAKASKQRVLVDFYADWCLDCKRMQRTTFTEDSVHSALKDWVLIEADVTVTNDDSEALKKFFDVFGPPATLFIKSDGSEYADLRQYGYMNKDDFLTIISQATL